MLISQFYEFLRIHLITRNNWAVALKKTIEIKLKRIKVIFEIFDKFIFYFYYLKTFIEIKDNHFAKLELFASF